MNENNIFYIFLFLSFFSLPHNYRVLAIACYFGERENEAAIKRHGETSSYDSFRIRYDSFFASLFRGARLPKRHNFCIKICLFRQPKKAHEGGRARNVLLFSAANDLCKTMPATTIDERCFFLVYFERVRDRKYFSQLINFIASLEGCPLSAQKGRDMILFSKLRQKHSKHDRRESFWGWEGK